MESRSALLTILERDDMGAFNIVSAIAGGLQGLAMGNPIAAAAGAVAGGFTGNANAATGVGNLGNAAANGWQGAILGQQDLDNFRNAAFNLQLQEQSSAFDNMLSEKSELMHESNTLRDVAMVQRKADNEITKKFIESIV